MTYTEVFSIVAVLLSPLIALQVQRWLDDGREKKARKLWIFKTLMSTRGSRLSNDHVFALNQIDLEFSPKKPQEKRVIEAWRAYLDHLNTSYTPQSFDNWLTRQDDLLVDVLYEMGLALGYAYGKTEIKRSIYVPKGHVEADIDRSMIRSALIDVLQGNRRIPVDLGLPSMTSPAPQVSASNPKALPASADLPRAQEDGQ